MQAGIASAESPLNLRELARALTAPGMPAQAVIGLAAGVSQSTVSRAAARKIGDTPGARRLWTYVSTRPSVAATPSPMPSGAPASRRRKRVAPKTGDADLKRAAVEGLRAYLDDEFDPQLVLDQLMVLRRAQRVNARGRQSSKIAG